jgi:L-methionine (R)-S-oxide reductase
MVTRRIRHSSYSSKFSPNFKESYAIARTLREMEAILTFPKTFEEYRPELAAIMATLLNAKQCSITPLTADKAQVIGVRLYATFGPSKVNDHTTTSQEAIDIRLARDETDTQFSRTANVSQIATVISYDHAITRTLICAPILLDRKIIGVIQISDPKHRPHFNEADLNLVDVATLVIEKSLQVIQLKNVLNSRFAQIALVQNTDKAIGDVLLQAAQCPNEMVRLIAKSFFREMTKAGFGSKEIINTASEIISQLSRSLQKHSKRVSGRLSKATADNDR